MRHTQIVSQMGRHSLNGTSSLIFFLDNLKAVKDKSAPDGDGGVGVLRNSNAGGFAALSYAVTEEVKKTLPLKLIYSALLQTQIGDHFQVLLFFDRSDKLKILQIPLRF